MPETAQALDLRPGALYRFAGIRAGGRRWKYPPATYRLLGVALDVHTYQERVVYEGVGPPDDGVLHLCGLEDWGRLFTALEPPVQAPVPPPPPPERAAGPGGAGVILERLRRLAAGLAAEHREPALLLAEPPRTQVHRTEQSPYAVLLSQATREELAARHERFEPPGGPDAR